MHKVPEISVVVPTYNGERYLGTTLDSVRGQTFENWEAIVVDDGSSDGTRTMAESYAACDRRIRVVSQENAGIAAARNNGLRQCDPTSPFVAFLDHDDIWEPDALVTLRNALVSDREYPAAHGRACSIDQDGEPFGFSWVESMHTRRHMVGRHLRHLSPVEPTTYDALIYRNVIPTVGVALLRRSLLPSDNLFDQDACPSEDWDLWLRLSRQNPIAYVDRIVLRYRIHGSNASSSNHRRMWAAIVRVVCRAVQAPDATPAQRALAAAWIERYWRQITHRYCVWARDGARDGHYWQAIMNIRRASQAYVRSITQSTSGLLW